MEVSWESFKSVCVYNFCTNVWDWIERITVEKDAAAYLFLSKTFNMFD